MTDEAGTIEARVAAGGDRAAAARYVDELSAEFAAIARQHGLDAPGYILDMARLEAESVNRTVGGPH